MSKLRILDLFCGAGGAAVGYARMGFEVIGVDIKPQPKYPFKFVQADALEVLADWHDEDGGFPSPWVATFDAIHASPPCQASSALRSLHPERDYPELIPPTRELLKKAALPYIIENVPGAGLREPVTLCGSMFGLSANGRQLRRHRLFECSFPVMRQSCQHRGQPVGVYGDGGGGDYGRGYKGSTQEYREAMGIDWASKTEIAQAIPPAYTEHIGAFLSAEIKSLERLEAAERPHN